MDNNLNTNGTGIPNVNDIKVEETPAESFENLYGKNSGATPVSNQQPVGTNNIGMQPNPGMNQTVSNSIPNNVQPVEPNNIGMQLNPTMNQTVVNSVPNNVQPVGQNNIGMQPNPTMNQNVVNPVPNNVQPVGPNNMDMQPNPTINQTVINPVPNNAQPLGPNNMDMQPNPNMNQNIGTPLQDNMAQMTPNPGVIMTPNTNQNINNNMDLSSVDIDKQRMQSIEEQLSKTSQYNPEDLQQEKITIPSDNQYEKNKSGLAFVIVLFIILAVVIAFLPQITKWIR